MPPKTALRFVTAFSAFVARRSDKLGEGGNGTVYRAEEEDTGASVAVKVLDPHKVRGSREKARRFQNEIRFCQSARHPNVLPVLDTGSVALDGADAPFYVMPLYATTLRGLIGRGIPHDRVLPLFAGVLDGVEAAHLKGVVHRDLKPENVLHDAERDALVVGDFGVAQFSDEELFTAVETRPGTRLANFEYAAPEQRTKGREVDARSDIYALGLILNEMFTGVVPHGTGYRTVAGVAPRYAFLDDLVAEMLQQSRRERPQSIDAVKLRLRAAQQEYVIRQQLDELQGTVVPASTIVDPLLDDPIRIVGVEATGPDAIALVLNRAPTRKWIDVMRGVGNYRYTMGYNPREMSLNGPRIALQAPEHEMQDVVDSYREFLLRVAQEYPRVLAREASEREQQERRELQARAEAERRRLALQQRIRI